MNRASGTWQANIWRRARGAALLAGFALAVPVQAGGQPPAPPARERPAAFAPCAACHTVERGRNAFGPSLAGIGGRKAGSLPGYGYSAALKASGVVWDARTLDRWITAPQKMVPGTRMPFPGLADPAKRKQIVDYLLSLE